jgi:hypothetical protein
MSSSASNPSTDFKALRASLLERFETELREQRDIDAASRESMLAQMEQSLDNMSSLQDPTDASQIRASLAQTLGVLHASGLVDQAGSEEVEQAFAESYRVFDNPGVKRALEFARISREQGEEAARVWLAAQEGGNERTAA